MKNTINKVDRIVALAILVISGLLWALFLVNGSGRAQAIVIEVDSKLYARYRMAEIEAHGKTMEISTKYGKNELYISKEGAQITFSNCPDKACSLQGKITKPGQRIVCVPHRLVIYIEGENSFDTISY